MTSPRRVVEWHVSLQSGANTVVPVFSAACVSRVQGRRVANLGPALATIRHMPTRFRHACLGRRVSLHRKPTAKLFRGQAEAGLPLSRRTLERGVHLKV